jgi:hypothetical protein
MKYFKKSLAQNSAIFTKTKYLLNIWIKQSVQYCTINLSQMNSIEKSILTQAIIFLKNGIRKYGFIINDNSINNSFQFISNINFSAYQKDLSIQFIEELDVNLISFIEVDLK